MPELLDFPVALAASPFDPAGKTVGDVVDQIFRALHRTGIEPEYASLANFMGDADEARYGFPGASPWPPARAARSRLVLSIQRGNSEGWIIQTDYIRFVEPGDSGHWQSWPLMRIKALSRSQAWAIAAVVSRMLDID